jgi:hypothetical protein
MVYAGLKMVNLQLFNSGRLRTHAITISDGMSLKSENLSAYLFFG